MLILLIFLFPFTCYPCESQPELLVKKRELTLEQQYDFYDDIIREFTLFSSSYPRVWKSEGIKVDWIEAAKEREKYLRSKWNNFLPLSTESESIISQALFNFFTLHKDVYQEIATYFISKNIYQLNIKRIINRLWKHIQLESSSYFSSQEELNHFCSQMETFTQLLINHYSLLPQG